MLVSSGRKKGVGGREKRSEDGHGGGGGGASVTLHKLRERVHGRGRGQSGRTLAAGVDAAAGMEVAVWVMTKMRTGRAITTMVTVFLGVFGRDLGCGARHYPLYREMAVCGSLCGL